MLNNNQNDVNLNDIVNYNVKKSKKYKLDKAKKIIAIGLSAVVFVGCVNAFKGSKKNDSEKTTTYTSSVNNVTVENGDDDIIEVSSLNAIPIGVSINQYKEFESYVNSIETNYVYSNLYDIDASLAKYNSDPISNNYSRELLDSEGKLNSTKLYYSVIKNNKEFIEKKNVTNCFYDEMKNDDLVEVCNTIVDVINDIKARGEFNINYEAVCSNLNSLKVYNNNTSASNAYITQDLCLLTNPGMIELFQKINKDQDAEKAVIVHEIMHLIQFASSDCNSKNGTEVGICRRYETGINSLYWSWFLEGSAEKCGCLYTGERNTMYSPQIGYLESINLCNLLRDDFKVETTEKLNFSSDINDLYKLFNVTTNSQKMEILNMMYSVEIIQSDPKEFLEVYNQQYGIDLRKEENSRNVFKHELRCEVLETLNKHFYKNLAKKLVNKNVTLQDMFYLINVWESDLQAHLLFKEDGRLEKSTDFLNRYTELQNELFELVSINLNCSVDDILNEFNNYSTRVSCGGINKDPNCDLLFLTTNKKDYIKERKENIYKKGYDNLRNMTSKIKTLN